MTLNKTYLTIALQTVTAGIMLAQNPNIESIIEKLNEPHLFGEVIYSHRQTAGEQFYHKTWSNGSVTLTNGKVSSNQVLNYNRFLDQLVLFNSTTLKSVYLDKNVIHEFTLQNPFTNQYETFRNIEARVQYQLKPTNIFAQVLLEGGYSLFAFRQVIESGKVTYRQNNRIIEIPEIKPRTLYYIKFPDGSYIAIKKASRRALIKTLPFDKAQIKRVISENKLRVRKEEDLIMLFKKLNEL